VSGRAKRLQRLAAIRMMTEELDLSALKVALTAVAEVESALTEQDNSVFESKANARIALLDGDRGEWMMADAQREVARWNCVKLERFLAVRKDTAGAAMAKFLESRCEHEQVKQLVEDARQAAQVEDARRSQTAADDWFLSKRPSESQ
jgi:hypothetical protein